MNTPIGLIDKAFLLKKTPLFQNVDLDSILAAADKLGLADWDPNEVIFNAGDEATRMYFIAKGKVQAGEEVLESPAFFGDEALFNEKPRAYTAKALEDTLLLTLSKTNLLTIISECPQVAIGLLNQRMP
ncbi:MAG: cyclic nucleotide-binding domain-containing protein [Chlamydiia bacterium]|nr:cyclic nucleotide-binding domain-containing protein [Chlamydiia bacterium]